MVKKYAFLLNLISNFPLPCQFREIVGVDGYNNIKHINALYRKNPRVFKVVAGRTYGCHCSLSS
jgi:hypothetical protein